MYFRFAILILLFNWLSYTKQSGISPSQSTDSFSNISSSDSIGSFGFIDPDEFPPNSDCPVDDVGGATEISEFGLRLGLPQVVTLLQGQMEEPLGLADEGLNEYASSVGNTRIVKQQVMEYITENGLEKYWSGSIKDFIIRLLLINQLNREALCAVGLGDELLENCVLTEWEQLGRVGISNHHGLRVLLNHCMGVALRGSSKEDVLKRIFNLLPKISGGQLQNGMDFNVDEYDTLTIDCDCDELVSQMELNSMHVREYLKGPAAFLAGRGWQRSLLTNYLDPNDRKRLKPALLGRTSIALLRLLLYLWIMIDIIKYHVQSVYDVHSKLL